MHHKSQDLEKKDIKSFISENIEEIKNNPNSISSINLTNNNNILSNNTPKRISKLTLLLEKNKEEIKEYDNLVKQEINNSNDFSGENDEFNNNLYEEEDINCTKIEKINFNVHIYFNFNNQESIYSIESSIFNENQYIYELIIDIINKFNCMKKQITFDNKKYNINLKGIDHDINEKQFIQNNYLLKPAKKKF